MIPPRALSQAPFAALFPGQLSEKAGMGEALAARYGFVADWFEEVSRRAGVDLARTFFGGGAPCLHDDRPAQVGVFAVSIAAFDVLGRIHGLAPAAAAGYSLGTYAAFAASGVLERGAALEVLLTAEHLLAEDRFPGGAGPGGMGFVIGLSRSELQGAIDELRRERNLGPEALSIGTENAARQFVLTGERAAVETAIERVRPRSLKAGMLPIALSMHSPRLGRMTRRLRTLLDGKIAIRTPKLDLYAPMLGRRVSSLDELSSVLFSQLSQASHWSGTLSSMAADGFSFFAEVGPGDVLTKLLRWTLREAKGLVVETPEDAEAFARELPAPEAAGRD